MWSAKFVLSIRISSLRSQTVNKKASPCFIWKAKKLLKCVFQKKVLEKRGGRKPKEKQEQLVFLLLEVLQAPESP